MQHNPLEDLLSIFNPPPATSVKPTPPLVSPPRKDYEDLFQFLWNTIINTPDNLKKAFTFNAPGAVEGPDSMSKISNTAKKGAKGVKDLKGLFKLLEGN